MNEGPGQQQRRGIALAVAVLALVVVGAVITGGFYAASQENRAGRTTKTSELAFYTAEKGLNDQLGDRGIPFYEDTLEVGQDTALPAVAVTAGGIDAEYRVRVLRVAERLFYIQSTGRITDGSHAGAEREVGIVARTPYFNYRRDRALQTQTGFRMRGNAYISGRDTVPPGWENCETPGTGTGVAASDTSQIDIGGSAAIDGDPAKEEVPLDSTDILDYGDLKFSDFAGTADKYYAAGTGTLPDIEPEVDGGRCVTSAASNWGGPIDGGPCGDYWPTVYAEGDLGISGSGYGQGILAVEGDLSITGGFQFTGIVLVKGDLAMTGDGSTILGTANVRGTHPDSTRVESRGAGRSSIQLSSCAIARAYEYNRKLSRAFGVPGRHWVDLSAVGRGP